MSGSSNYDYNQYTVGSKVYNGGSNSPHSGKTLDPMGYRERDLRIKAQRNAMLRRLQSVQRGDFMNSDALRGQK